MKKVIILINILFISFLPYKMWAQREVGLWETVSTSSGKKESVVEIYIQDGKLYGKIVKTLLDDYKDALCTECKGELKNKPMVGLQILKGLNKDKDEWYADKALLYPKNGEIYNCRVWLKDDNTLMVRGYLGFMYKTQTWQRVKK